MELYFVPVLVLSIVVVDLVRRIAIDRIRRKHSLPYPPGPTPIPLLGNVFGINAAAPYLTYQEWGRKYGDVIYTRLLNQDIIVLNSAKSACALLEKRSHNYSDRPFLATNDFVGWHFNSVNLRYSDKWRLHRRMFHQAFRADAALNYRPIQLSKVHQLLDNILDSPDDYEKHLQTLSSSTILALTYGYNSAPKNDPLNHEVETALSLAMSELTPERAVLLNAFPILKHIPPWFPFADFKRRALRCQKAFANLLEVPFRFTKQSMAMGTATPCMVYDLLRRIEDKHDPNLELAVKESSATASIAGAETTFSVLSIFILAMVLNPDVQKRAQAELDATVGQDRLPVFEDRSSLPYVDAVLRETLRWRPVVPMGVPHAAVNSDEYEGCFIPAGATVMANVWAIARDEAIYPEPSLFKPERFLMPDGELTDDTVDFAFGFGRRICVGRYVADASIWAGIVSMLSLFKFSKAKNERGEDIDFKLRWSTGVSNHPLPFPCSIEPRIAGMNSDKLAQLARSTQ